MDTATETTAPATHDDDGFPIDRRDDIIQTTRADRAAGKKNWTDALAAAKIAGYTGGLKAFMTIVSPPTVKTPGPAAASPAQTQETGQKQAARRPAKASKPAKAAKGKKAAKTPAPKKPKAAKTPKQPKAPKQPKKEKGISGLDAAAAVVAKAQKPLTAKEITDRVLKMGWTTKGKTPDRTINSAIIREIAALKKKARFIRTDRGLFTANDADPLPQPKK